MASYRHESALERQTIGWFSPGILARPSSFIQSVEQRDKLEFVDRTAKSLIVGNLATLSAMQDIEIVIENEASDVYGRKTNGWRRIHIIEEEQLPTDGTLRGLKHALGTVGLHTEAYKKVQEDMSEGDAYIHLLLSNAQQVGFRDPLELLSYAPIVSAAPESDSPVAPLKREYYMDGFAGAIALYSR
jgi:hypothetical protein